MARPHSTRSRAAYTHHKMPVDTSASYKLLVEWVSNNVVIGSIGEVHPFYEWAVELGLSAQQLTDTMEYYDGSSPERPEWFELAPTVPTGMTYDSLTDTPSTKAGKAGKAVRVSGDETKHEYYDAGDVRGPASSVPGAPALFIGTTGKVLDSGAAPLGNAAYKNVGTTANTLAAGDDPRFGLLPEPEVKHLVPYARKTGYGTYDLEFVYGLNWRNSFFQLKDLYQLADAKVKFALLFSWYNAAGKSDAWVMNMSHLPACHNEAVLQGHHQGNWGSGRIDSRNHITWPVGNYRMNHHAWIDGGHYRGSSSSYSWSNGGNGTALIMDEAGWQGDMSFRNLLESTTKYASSIWTAYLENSLVENVRLEGQCHWKDHDPSYRSNGISIFRSGENFKMDQVFASGFNGYGIEMIGSTPLHAGTLSCFSNTYGGLGVVGGDLSTQNIGVLSGDDNPALLRVDSYDDGSNTLRAGGCVNIGLIKHETGKRNPRKGQMVCIADGHTGTHNNEGAYLNLTVGVVSMDSQPDIIDALFVVNGFTDTPQPRGTTSGGRKARISVGGIRGHNYRSILHDLDQRVVYNGIPDYDNFGFTWNGKQDDLNKALNVPLCDLPIGYAITRTAVNSIGRLGLINYGGSFNYAAGTPGYDETNLLPITAPPSDFNQIFCAVDKGILGMGDTAQCKAISIDYNFNMMAGAPVTWSIDSGPATISGGGVVTPTGTGDVVIRALGISGVGFCYMKVTP